MNVTVSEVLQGAEVRAVPLSAECVGYLVLAAADQISTAPRRVEPSDVLLFEDGGIRVASGRATDDSAAERDLRLVLDALLLRASGPTSGLLRASRRPSGAGVEALVRELETALIPVNRAAAKRSLARLERETVRALQSGRIQPASTPPAQPSPAPAPTAAEPPSLPVAAAVAPREPSAQPPAVVAHEPPAVMAHEPRALAHEPVVAEVASLAADSPLRESFELRDRTLVLAKVAPRNEAEPQQAEPQLVETRPEPVVLRASARPPAPPSAAALEPPVIEPVRTERLPRVALVAASVPDQGAFSVLAAPVAAALAEQTALTPLLGTRMAETSLPVSEAAESASAAADDDFEIIEVLLAPEELTVVPEDVELIYSEGSDWTLPCPPLAAESMLPPPSMEVSAPEPEREPAVAAELAPVAVESVELAADVHAAGVEVEVAAAAADDDEVEVAVELQSAELEVGAGADDEVEVGVAVELPSAAVEAGAAGEDEVELQAAEVEVGVPAPEVVESELPAWVTAVAVADEVTPPPRVAVPEPRPSDVDELLLRLGEMPLAVDELCTGLKRLAGMEPTPPPPGVGHHD